MIHPTTDGPEVTTGPGVHDPAIITAFRDKRERFNKNLAWFEAHAVEIGAKHPGRYVCVAGEALFVGDDPAELFARARTAYPDDWGGFFTKYIPTRVAA